MMGEDNVVKLGLVWVRIGLALGSFFWLARGVFRCKWLS